MAALIQEVWLAARRTFSHGLNKDPSFQENFNELVKLMTRVKGRDVNFNVSLLHQGSSNINRSDRAAPVTYIHLFEDQHFSMGIFVLRENARIPLHDHPGMYGLIKVIHGNISVKSFDHLILSPEDDPSSSSSTTKTHSSSSSGTKGSLDVSRKKFPDSSKSSSAARPFLEVPHREVSVDDDCCCILTPTKGNVHEVKPCGGPAAFLDILAPPYDMETSDRRCFYYENLPSSSLPDAKADQMSLSSSSLLDKYKNQKLQWLIQIQQPSDFWCDEAEYQGPELI